MVAKANAAGLGISGYRGKTPVNVLLDSPGGSLLAAIGIGQIVRDEKLNMVTVPWEGRCVSACVLVLAAGLEKVVMGDVGIHRPYEDTAHITTEQGQRELYASLRTTVKEYLQSMNVPGVLYDMMFRIPPEKVRYLGRDELQDLNLNEADPFFKEGWDAKEANELGMTKQNYIQYQREALGVYRSCGRAISRGDYSPEGYHECLSDKLQELQGIFRERSGNK